MFRCLIFFFVFFFNALNSWAGPSSSSWDCKKKGEEWLCVTGEKLPVEKSGDQTGTLGLEEIPVKSTDEGLPVFSTARPKPMPAPPPRSVAKRPGWTCKTNEENEDTWDCSLVGPDPKGRLRVVEGEEAQARLLNPAFNLNQESLFKMMQTDLVYDPWQTCDWSQVNNVDLSEQKSLRESTPMDVNADYSEIFDKEVTSFSGNVDIVRADQHIEADMATYDSVSNTMDAQGNVYYREAGISLFSDTALLKLDSDQAVLRDVLFVSPETRGRGAAKVAYRDSNILSRFKDVAYTSCRPGNQDWVLHASRLKANKHTGKVSAKHAWLEFKGVPFLYTPYISFPIDDRRQSGFLSPTFGNRDDTGFDITIPYYFNLATNMDATFKPRIMTDRGLMLAGDFRYLTETSNGKLDVEYLPYDAERKDIRGSASWQHKTKFTENLLADIDVNWVSDDDYIDELSNTLNFSNRRNIRSRADLTYRTDNISFLARAENYQTIDKQISGEEKPYRRLPQVRLDLDETWNVADIPIRTEMENEFVYFHKSDYKYNDMNVLADKGMRLNIKPSISLPYVTPAMFITPKIAVQHTQYWLDEREPGLPNDISRTLPIFSVDSGLFFEREFNSGLIHTIEPRLYYLYIPYNNQDDIPDFDTSDYDFNYNQMFRDNSFSGGDRIQNANQVTAALTSRLIDADSGVERLNLTLGEIYYFENPDVTLPNEIAPKRTLSNVIGLLSGQLTDQVSFRSGVYWNPDVNELDRGEFSVRYKNHNEQIFNVGYRYRNTIERQRTDGTVRQIDGISQSDVSFVLPFYKDWNVFGRWQYSFDDSITVDSFLGVEKDSCCWRFRVMGRRYMNNINSSPRTGIFVQLELKGLTNFGDKVENFLEKSIRGYRIPQN